MMVRMAMRTMPSGWSKNLEQMEKRGNGFSLFFYVRTEAMQYLVVEEANGPLVDRQGEHLHERDVLRDNILVMEVQGSCDDRVDVVVRQNKDYRVKKKGRNDRAPSHSGCSEREC